MQYEEMLMNVAVGRVAYRATVPDMVIMRSGEIIVRRTYRKEKLDIMFMASSEEINAIDWQILDDEDDEDELYVDVLIARTKITPNQNNLRL